MATELVTMAPLASTASGDHDHDHGYGHGGNNNNNNNMPAFPAPAVSVLRGRDDDQQRQEEKLSFRSPGRSLKEISRRLGDVRRRSAEMIREGERGTEGSGDGVGTEVGEDIRPDDIPPPATAVSALQRWNRPRGNAWRLFFCFWSFMVAGMNDASVGALIPYLESYYSITYTLISLIFLTPFAGYSLAALVNARLHEKFGQRGISIAAPLFHIVTYTVLCCHPPWPVLVVINSLSGFGNGMVDACFCAWIAGSLANPNTIQGFLHSSYSVGALIAPLVATSMVTRFGMEWYEWYYVMVAASVVELVGLTVTFWHRTGAVYRAEHPREEGEETVAAGEGQEGERGGERRENKKKSGGSTREALRSRVTWTATLFFFTYMGCEVGLGGWVTSFMLKVRHASEFKAGVSATGFWAGMAAGRAGLGMVTERYGERLCVAIYLACAVALQLVFWLVPQFVVSAVAVALLGFFLGPMFPGGIIMATKLLPKHLHVSAVGFAMAVGGIGGTVFPFAIGAIAGSKGVGVLQPIIMALVVVLLGVWLSFPRIKKPQA